jgi:predicted transcriptional regulator
MSQSVVELAKELTLALIETGNVAPEDMQETLQKTYATLTALKAQEESGVFAPAPVSETVPVDWRKSITKHAVTCLACGRAFKQLSLRHLGMHGLDSGSYRTRYGIPRTQPLSARDTTARRRQVVQEIRPWEKAPHFLHAQVRNGHTSPESDIEAMQGAAEEIVVPTPAQSKRQRKTTSKKKSPSRV